MPSQPTPLSRLTTVGVQVSIGPFLVRVRSDLDGVHEYLRRLYGDFQMAAGEGGHADSAG